MSELFKDVIVAVVAGLFAFGGAALANLLNRKAAEKKERIQAIRVAIKNLFKVWTLLEKPHFKLNGQNPELVKVLLQTKGIKEEYLQLEKDDLIRMIRIYEESMEGIGDVDSSLYLNLKRFYDSFQETSEKHLVPLYERTVFTDEFNPVMVLSILNSIFEDLGNSISMMAEHLPQDDKLTYLNELRDFKMDLESPSSGALPEFLIEYVETKFLNPRGITLDKEETDFWLNNFMYSPLVQMLAKKLFESGITDYSADQDIFTSINHLEDLIENPGPATFLKLLGNPDEMSFMFKMVESLKRLNFSPEEEKLFLDQKPLYDAAISGLGKFIPENGLDGMRMTFEKLNTGELKLQEELERLKSLPDFGDLSPFFEKGGISGLMGEDGLGSLLNSFEEE